MACKYVPFYHGADAGGTALESHGASARTCIGFHKAEGFLVPDPSPALSPAELRRYARHLTIPEFGMEGQRKLRAARVLCIGAGGLGSPIAMYLAAAGVGTIGIVDADVVDESNLQRQILHSTADVGRSKLDSARDRLSGINPHVRIETH